MPPYVGVDCFPYERALILPDTCFMDELFDFRLHSFADAHDYLWHLPHLLTQDRLVTPRTGQSPALCRGIPIIPAFRTYHRTFLLAPLPPRRELVLVPWNRYVRSTGRTGDSRMICCRFPCVTALRAGDDLLLDLLHVHSPIPIDEDIRYSRFL